VPDRRRAETIDDPSPGRLYATLVGGLLVVLGIVGFFYSASFGGPGKVDQMFGALAVNGWLNALHVLTGALGLLVAGFAARRYALLIGALYLALAVWGFVLGGEATILGFLPANTGDDLLHLALGLLGLAAAAASSSTAASKSAAPGRKPPEAAKA
jgi:Domain of unknown function (DUF4383)